MEKKTMYVIGAIVAGVAAVGATIWALCRKHHVNADEVAENVGELIEEATEKAADFIEE